MRIYVDADACPVVRQTEEVAQRYGVGVTLLCDTNHVLRSDYSEVKVIGAGSDAVDFALVNLCRAGDVVVTQDYGVAAMALGKRAYVIHQQSKWLAVYQREYRAAADGAPSYQESPKGCWQASHQRPKKTLGR